MGAFRYDNPLIRAMVRVADMMIVSFFWLVCCLPVVTVLPASAALYRATVKSIRGDGNRVVSCFFRAFTGSLKKGIPLTLITAASGAFLGYTVWFGFQLQQQSTAGTVYFLVGCTLALLWAAVVSNLPPVLSRFEGGIGMYLRLAAYFAAGSLVTTVLRLLLLALVVFLADFYPIAMLLLPGLYADLTCGGIEKRMCAFITENGLQEDEEEASEQEGAEQEETDSSSLRMDALYGEEEQKS